MNTLILDTQIFHVGEYAVTVLKQDEIGSDKPHQVFIKAEINEIKKQETWSYPAAAVVNRDCDFFDYSQARAEKFVRSFVKFLKTPKGVALSTETVEGSQPNV